MHTGVRFSWTGFRPRRVPGAWLVVAMLCLLFFGMATACARGQVFEGQPPKGFQTILHWTVYDVDEGDAMLLTSGGESLLVDGGPWAFRDMLRRRLAEAGYMHLDRVVNTHYHDDHIDGLYSLFQHGFTAGEYLHGYSDTALARNERGQRTARAATEAGASLRQVVHGDTFSLGQAQVQVFQCTAIDNTNTRSLVLRVACGEASLLLCADITGAAQHWLMEQLPPMGELLRNNLFCNEQRSIRCMPDARSQADIFEFRCIRRTPRQ